MCNIFLETENIDVITNYFGRQGACYYIEHFRELLCITLKFIISGKSCCDLCVDACAQEVTKVKLFQYMRLRIWQKPCAFYASVRLVRK